jgi:hypothetical protein
MQGPGGRLRRMAIDHVSGRSEVELADGTVVAGPNIVIGATGIRTVAYDFPTRTILMTTTAGDDVWVQAGERGKDVEALGGRPVVYLDQNHWITLARHLHAPDRVLPRDRDAAAWLVERALRADVVLPLSAAHAVETGKAGGRWRRHLAPTLIGLSHGWQMRSPLTLRGDEIAATMRGVGGEPTVVPPVFVLEPGAIFGEYDGDVASEGLVAEFAELQARLSWAEAIFDTLLHEEPVLLGGLDVAKLWADGQYETAVALRDDPAVRREARTATLLRVLQDLRHDIAAAAARIRLDDAVFEEWLANVEDAFARMPYLGRVREATHHRLLNADDRWETNDLNDLHFLACGAGYADVVVAERKATDYLSRAWRGREGGAVITSRLDELIPVVDRLLAARGRDAAG